MSYDPSDAKDIFLKAVELTSAEERSTYLDRACGANLHLRARIDDLLRSHNDAGTFLGQPALEELAATRVGSSQPGDQDGTNRRPVADTTGSNPAGVPLDFLDPCATPGRIGKLGVYEIIEVIGQGGMGIVLKAQDTKLNRIVAVKVLAAPMTLNVTAATRFLREAQAAAAVSHGHVVTIFAVEEASVPPYLVMECIVGQSLQQKIDRRGALTTTEILRIGMQVADGLAAAHKQGLIHRDIKPANILLENGVERVKITDFGLARAMDDVGMTQTGQVTGTPQYMSPEQAMGEHLDARSDLFSLGSVLYAMCTGRPAFRAESAVAVLRRVCDDTPRPIAEINPDIPDWLIVVIDKLLAKRREDRFQSAAEVFELLSEYLAWFQQPQGRNAPSLRQLAPQSSDRRHHLLRYWINVPIAAFVIWALLFPAFGLLVSNQAQVKFEIPGGDTAVEMYRDGILVATQLGYSQVNVSSGTYEFRVGKHADVRPCHFEFEHQTWWFRRNNVASSAPQVLPLSRGDQVTVRLSFVENATAPRPSGADSRRGASTTDEPPLAAVPFNEQEAGRHQEAWARHLGVPVEFTDPLGITFRLIPAGTFEMGSSAAQVNALLRELQYNGLGEFDKFAVRSSAPQHPVRLSRPFYMADCEITVAQFANFVDAKGYRSTLEAVKSPPFTWKSLAAGQDGDRQPVVGVSWEDAWAFCRWLSSEQHAAYELPSEAQWEYACRAGSAGLWSFGDDPTLLETYAVFDQTNAPVPSPVKGKHSNAFGLYDMHGNVEEWCLDWHRQDYYGRSPSADPACLEEMTDPASGRAARGGLHGDAAARSTRSASRSYDFPELPVRSRGFRVTIVGDLKSGVVKPDGSIEKAPLEQ